MSGNTVIHPAGLPSAIAWHLGQLFSFRHDGRGLPKLDGAVVWVLIVLKLSLGALAQMQLLPELGLGSVMLKSLVVTGLLYANAKFSHQAHAFSGYLLLWLGLDSGLLLMSLVTDLPQAFISFCYAWGLLAYIALLFRARDYKNE